MAQFCENGFFLEVIQLIRLFDHPFIPLFFHWRTSVIRVNHEKAASPAVFINRRCAQQMHTSAHEMKVFSTLIDLFPDHEGTACPDENLNTLTAGYFET